MKSRKLDPDIVAVMKKLGIAQRTYVSHDDECIYTSMCTIEDWRMTPKMASVNRGPIAGNNETGHKLPASST